MLFQEYVRLIIKEEHLVIQFVTFYVQILRFSLLNIITSQQPPVTEHIFLIYFYLHHVKKKSY